MNPLHDSDAYVSRDTTDCAEDSVYSVSQKIPHAACGYLTFFTNG